MIAPRAIRRVLPLMLLLALLGSRPARAFIPLDSFEVNAPNAQTHQSITRSVLTDLSKEFFNVDETTDEMDTTIAIIVGENAGVDGDQTKAWPHFDGESFAQGQKELTGNLLKCIKDNLGAAKVAGARRCLGQALHTIQDFYAHSNWVELGNNAPHPDLAVVGKTLTATDEKKTCVACKQSCAECANNVTATKLTSGYYGGEDVKPVDGKCNHGGARDTSVKNAFAGMNKDSSSCEGYFRDKNQNPFVAPTVKEVIAPHQNRHVAAATLATQATTKFVRELKDAITAKELRLLLGAGDEVKTAMDTSAGMGAVIAGVRSGLAQIVAGRQGTDLDPARYVLVPFNDPSTQAPTVTDDPTVYDSALGAFVAGGGGDCPDLALAGILRALAVAAPSGWLFVFTDGGAKDGILTPAAMGLAAAKGIRVMSLLFGDCGFVDPAYTLLAGASGGQVFSLSWGEAESSTLLVDRLARPNATSILYVSDQFTGGPARTYDVPIDGTVTSATFSVSGTTSVLITRPGGAAVSPSLVLGSGVITVVDGLGSPDIGTWQVTVDGPSGTPFSIAVSGESPLALETFDFVRLRGRPGHGGAFPIAGLPASGSPVLVDAVVRAGFSSAQFDLRTAAGNPLGPLMLASITDGHFFGSATPPAGASYLYVSGTEAGGSAYQRVRAGAVGARSVVVSPPRRRELAPGTTETYRFRVTNLGPPSGFLVATFDEGAGPGTQVLPTIGTNETVPVDVGVTIPADAGEGTDTLAVAVASTSDPTVWNSAVLMSRIRPPAPCSTDTDCDDLDGCTADQCVSGRCANPTTGCGGATCLVGLAAGEAFCDDEALDADLEMKLDRKLIRAQLLLAKACLASTPDRKTRRLTAVDRRLYAVRKKADRLTRRGKIPTGCGAEIDQLLDDLRQQVQLLAS